MAYSNFSDLTQLAETFGLSVDFQARLFEGEYGATPSDFLQTALREYEPLALAIGTEKARSELLIMPVLAEVRRQREARISLFSGIEFNVDPARGLTGFCDYLLSRSPNPYTLHAPVLAVVEAKNERITLGLAQCAAEMVAARLFNERAGNAIPTIYGTVTTGTNWRFLRLSGDLLEVDGDEEFLHPISRLLGILLTIAS